MEEHKESVIRKIRAYGIIKDSVWLEKPDEPVPMWVLLDALLQVIDRLDPSEDRPFD
ncbi:MULTISPECIES: hypothetical protein [unclassified Paenibacillus]|uniref:hypothetical protein n=1 Tax=unclassified Paenibacillus TaxID=185978 RepID=UPI0009563BBB|nr:MULTISPECIES: hypothetical protein [unclassified Paenibacillus]SIQ44099.1 hypothetical protein SAMN05880555_1754 [Paenibacillus sp. RU4X]SIQ66423.1 hypothetical protein SAMN05880570_1752 [Paenibacillus sp. RU4T]